MTIQCPKCGCDPTPIEVAGVTVRPCGLLRENEWVMDMAISNCPMQLAEKDTDQ